MARTITLATDIGWAYAAQMKGEIARVAPSARVVDLTHDLPAHGIREAAFLLLHMGRRFPAGTVHLGVVDPGVGGARAPVAVLCKDGSYLVGPDNGLLSPLAEELEVDRCVRIRAVPRRSSTRRAPTFEGRDLFAPAAARLALGVPIDRLGPPHPLAGLELTEGRKIGDRLVGTVVHIDRFGNLITDLPDRLRPASGRVRVRVGDRRSVLAEVVRTYDDLPRRGVGLLTSSFDRLELAVREGSAARRTGARVGDRTVIDATSRVKRK